MKFSIVITTYNRLPLLQRAVNAALQQTQPCEVVVADDASTDGTQAYVESLGNRVVYCRNPKNMGHAATMNAGVKAASGDWIKPVDDDDYLAAHCIEAITHALQAYKNAPDALKSQAVICSCQAAQVDPQGIELSRTRAISPGQTCYIPQEDIHYGMLLEQVPFGTPIQVAFSRDAFLQSGGWDSSLDANCDDIDSWIKIAQFGDAIFMNQCLGYRTIWPGAYNQKFSLKTRLDTNILMKERIYPLVSAKHRADIPPLEQIRDYLKLHWSLVGLKQGKVLEAIQLAIPGMASLGGWSLLLESIASRKQSKVAGVRKILVME